MLRLAPMLPAALAAAGLLLLAAAEVAAQNRPGQGPQRLGAFQSWTAATHQENGQKVCYAFARAARSEGAPANRQPVTLTIAHRPQGRDQVAFSAGFPFGRNGQAVMAVGSAEFRSYATVQSSAFFDDGARIVAALRGGREAVARTPNGARTVTDAFPLAGFVAAYEAISRECPAPRAGARG